MSYNAKKALSYEMEEPSFLRRLRQGQSGGEQQQRYIAPRNKKRPTDDDEDAPTYVLEGGNDTISAREFKALNSVKTSEDAEKDNTPTAEKESATDEVTAVSLEKPLDTKEKILEAGSKMNKRKAVKMIGAEESDDHDTTGQDDEKLGRKKRTGGKAKGKQKVKLSFGEDE